MWTLLRIKRAIFLNRNHPNNIHNPTSSPTANIGEPIARATSAGITISPAPMIVEAKEIAEGNLSDIAPILTQKLRQVYKRALFIRPRTHQSRVGTKLQPHLLTRKAE